MLRLQICNRLLGMAADSRGHLSVVAKLLRSRWPANGERSAALAARWLHAGAGRCVTAGTSQTAASGFGCGYGWLLASDGGC